MPPATSNSQGIRPTLAELIALRARVQAWPPPQRAQGSSAGPATSPLRGRGMDYAESRLYAQGDDARHIDWRVTARTGRTHTKVFHAERDRVSLIIADTSPRLFFGTRVCFKSVQAAYAGALAAWAGQRSGDRISALRGSASEAPLPPAGGVRGALRVLDALNRWYQQPPEDDQGLDIALQSAARVSKPGSRMIALIDPRSVDGIDNARWTALSAHHDAVAVLLVDPLELAPPQARLAFAGDHRRVELDLEQGSTQAAWMHAFAERFEQARSRLRSLGWRAMSLSTDQAPDQVLAALLPYRREAA
ncbi:MAG: DUF58 domain-containing protein [Xanthomonadales bacterium]|nr:DUF58 domain-containing protein [Xanthomonadales bacterium]MCB1643398.1 DUF58 domain-containing protein [Xanthomonadales bacterium]